MVGDLSVLGPITSPTPYQQEVNDRIIDLEREAIRLRQGIKAGLVQTKVEEVAPPSGSSILPMHTNFVTNSAEITWDANYLAGWELVSAYGVVSATLVPIGWTSQNTRVKFLYEVLVPVSGEGIYFDFESRSVMAGPEVAASHLLTEEDVLVKTLAGEANDHIFSYSHPAQSLVGGQLFHFHMVFPNVATVGNGPAQHTGVVKVLMPVWLERS